MHDFTVAELEAAQKAIESTLRKNEKVSATLSSKNPPRTAQVNLVAHSLSALRLASLLVEGALQSARPIHCSQADLEESAGVMAAMIEKIEKIQPKLKEGTPQHTLAVRRIKAFQIALALIEEEAERS